MKVLTYLHSFEAGGVERDILRFNKAWKDAGLDVLIALGRREGPLESEAAPDVPIRQLQTGRFTTRHWETLWMILKLRRVIGEWQPDVLFCAGNSYTIVAVAVRLLMGRRCPPIVFRVSNDLVRMDMPRPMRAVYHWWLRFQAPFFARIVAMAPPVVPEILNCMKAHPARVAAIDNATMYGAELDRVAAARDAAARDRNGRCFLAIGRLAPQKNFALLIEAFAKIARPGDRLTICGEGALRPALERLATARGVADRIDMPGHVADLDSYLANADALVLSSDYEGLGMVVIEALAAGLPIVATDCGANMRMLVEEAGRVVPVGDSAALAMAMDQVVHAKYDIATMRARARRFTVEATTAQWVALFDTFRARNDAAIRAAG